MKHHEKANNNSSLPSAHVEPAQCNDSLAEGKDNEVVKKCSIHIHNKRKRLADPGGISPKAVIDGLRDAGVFPDDSARFIKEITESQELSKEDETIITVEWE